MNDNFYQAFETRFRGSRELIKQRLGFYVPFVSRLRQVYPDGEALDLGCGRGEWLELMREEGLRHHGVDLDAGMLSECHALDLSVSREDVLEYLLRQPTDSRVVVSGFHIAEHLPFDVLRQVVGEALRILQPGGLLILETPNPENITVATAGFYMDPTHQRPIPPALLAFVAEYQGFSRVKIVRLQEDPALRNKIRPVLAEVLNGVSPDYAIVAQKAAPPEIFDRFDELFQQETGITIGELAGRYQENVLRLEDQLARVESKADQAAAKAEQAQQELCSLYRSKSWRITAPLRASMQLTCQAFSAIKQVAKYVLKPFLRHLLKWIWRRPGLRIQVRAWLIEHPGLEVRVHRFAVNNDLASITRTVEGIPGDLPVTVSRLSPEAYKIYLALKVAAAAGHKEKRPCE